jgi:hypothetical protein
MRNTVQRPTRLASTSMDRNGPSGPREDQGECRGGDPSGDRPGASPDPRAPRLTIQRPRPWARLQHGRRPDSCPPSRRRTHNFRDRDRRTQSGAGRRHRKLHAGGCRWRVFGGILEQVTKDPHQTATIPQALCSLQARLSGHRHGASRPIEGLRLKQDRLCDYVLDIDRRRRLPDSLPSDCFGIVGSRS